MNPSPATPPPSPPRFWDTLLFVGVAQAVLSAALLLLVCNWHSIYEEDQLAKTAQIISLAHDSNWARFSTTANYYAKDMFSAYYLAALAFHELSRLPALETLNVFSILCGVVFFAAAPAFLRRAFGLPQWQSWFVLVSAPIFVISFNYGNEAAFAIAMTALAALALTFPSTGARVFAAACYVLATYSRTDYFFLWPALSFLLFARKEDRSVDWRQTGRNLAPFTIASAVLGTAWLLIVLRRLPQPGYDVVHHNPDPKIVAAFFMFSLNPVTSVFAFVGLVVSVARRRLKYLLLLPVLVQLAPYITVFDSPKYLLPSVGVLAIFALVGAGPLLKRAPLLLPALVALPWIISVTPYGVFGPSRSVCWYVPTDDGPLPTGGYLGFYLRVKQGFYQQRYDFEYAQFARAMPLIDARPPGSAFIVGYFNIGTAKLWAVRHGRWNISETDIPFWRDSLTNSSGDIANYLLKNSYLYRLKASAALREQLDSAFTTGRVKTAVGDAGDPFPDVIECGDSVPPRTDVELGQRIIFMKDHFQNNHILRRDALFPDLSGVAWIPRERFDQASHDSAKPLYRDSRWVCLDQAFPDAVYYSSRLPLVYGRSRPTSGSHSPRISQTTPPPRPLGFARLE